jgi:hypothetical protein
MYNNSSRMIWDATDALQGMPRHSSNSKQQHRQQQRLYGTCSQQMLSCKELASLSRGV